MPFLLHPELMEISAEGLRCEPSVSAPGAMSVDCCNGFPLCWTPTRLESRAKQTCPSLKLLWLWWFITAIER
ncbi:rCG58422 [Rattus norvegicus]|uniref:RCG58422 n=1 Tax=Rattus norvegicus TaxID=10116 RepID=A6J574_RAT|nr:rCG58422 [Rattus norvegicus]